MNTTGLGIFLIALGIVSLISGIAGGIQKMLLELQKEAAEVQHFGISDLPTTFIEALTKLLEALIKAPAWLALVIIGIFLIAWGGSML